MLKKIGIIASAVIILGCEKGIEEKSYSKEKYDYISELNEGKRVVSKGKKQGLIDEQERILLPIEYDFIKVEEDKIFTIKDGKTEVKNLTGDNLLTKEYSYIYPKGDFYLINENGKFGLIDEEEREVVSPKYDKIGEFVEGLAVVEVENKFGVINKFGEEIVPPKYAFIKNFSNGLALVIDENIKGGFIDTTGKEIVAPIYKYTEDFKGKSTIVVTDESYGVIDKNGDYTIPLQKKRINVVGEDLYSVEKEDNVYLINMFGENIVDTPFESIGTLKDNLIVVKENGKYGYIDKNGKKVIETKYEEIGEIRNNLILVKDKESEKFGVLNAKGKFTIEPKYEYVLANSLDYFIVGNSEAKEGVVNSKGKEIVPLQYKDLSFLNSRIVIGEFEDEKKIIVLYPNTAKEFVGTNEKILSLTEKEIITETEKELKIYDLN